MKSSIDFKQRLSNLKSNICDEIRKLLQTSTLENNGGWFALHHKEGGGYGVVLEPYDVCPVVTQINSDLTCIVEDGGDEYNEPVPSDERFITEFDVEIMIHILEIIEDSQPQTKNEDL
jgi:hypothetical protein